MTLTEVAAMLDLPTAEDVADLLRANEVKGAPHSWCHCPVVTFACRMTGTEVGTYGTGGAYAWEANPDTTGTDPHRWHHPVIVPKAARDFIRRFDNADPAFADLVSR